MPVTYRRLRLAAFISSSRLRHIGRLRSFAPTRGQLGSVEYSDEPLAALDEVWRQYFRVLEPGGRVIGVVDDVRLSRR